MKRDPGDRTKNRIQRWERAGIGAPEAYELIDTLGIDAAEMQIEERWKDPSMPSRYARG